MSDLAIVIGTATVTGVAIGTVDAASADGAIGIKRIARSLTHHLGVGFGRRPFSWRRLQLWSSPNVYPSNPRVQSPAE